MTLSIKLDSVPNVSVVIDDEQGLMLSIDEPANLLQEIQFREPEQFSAFLSELSEVHEVFYQHAISGPIGVLSAD